MTGGLDIWVSGHKLVALPTLHSQQVPERNQLSLRRLQEVGSHLSRAFVRLQYYKTKEPNVTLLLIGLTSCSKPSTI